MKRLQIPGSQRAPPAPKAIPPLMIQPSTLIIVHFPTSIVNHVGAIVEQVSSSKSDSSHSTPQPGDFLREVLSVSVQGVIDVLHGTDGEVLYFVSEILANDGRSPNVGPNSMLSLFGYLRSAMVLDS
ncbi:hypothetical protein E4U17_004224 [Claviceps sp. LM77 group G4]|nr:hypothetical protein E4U17_004224 [Claviceps sp. LM77 group G4]KAG6073697.1 hypothetical protein E4U16_004533 [Claviceps sp. LM84 group G4]